MTARKRARYGPDRGAGEQEPRSGGDHHEQVKAAETGVPVVLEMADAHYVVDSGHQPGGDADHDTDPAMGLRDDDERQDGRHDDRQSHPGVETLEEGGVTSERGLARPMLRFRGDIHSLGRARAAGARMFDSWHQKRFRGQLPPRPARCGQALEGEQGTAPENRGADAPLRIWERRTRCVPDRGVRYWYSRSLTRPAP